MTDPAQQVPEISVQEAAARGEQVLLLDVREDHEWQAGHAAAARHLPLSRLAPGAVPTDRPVVAVCRSGHRSGQAAVLLAAAGHDVVNMTGGMVAWNAAGLPVVDASGRPGQVA